MKKLGVFTVLTSKFWNTLQSLEHVLQNINKLNRSLEGVIAVCLFSIFQLCTAFRRMYLPSDFSEHTFCKRYEDRAWFSYLET